LEPLIGKHHPVALQVRELVDPLIRRRGMELVDIQFAEGGAAPTLRIFAQQPGGVNLQALKSLSEVISDLLDVEDPLPRRYQLEVSSPGLDRPLALARHFETALGEEVMVATSVKVDGSRKHCGVLSGFAPDQVVVQLDGASRVIPLETVEHAHVVYKFAVVERPGKHHAARKERNGFASAHQHIGKNGAPRKRRPSSE
jgi:ribosome maturation factor RimP